MMIIIIIVIVSPQQNAVKKYEPSNTTVTGTWADVVRAVGTRPRDSCIQKWREEMHRRARNAALMKGSAAAAAGVAAFPSAKVCFFRDLL
jgi:hypothetical protein